MYVLRKAKKTFPHEIGNLSTLDGRIRIFPQRLQGQTETKPRYKAINTTEELDEYLLKQVNKTSKDIIGN